MKNLGIMANINNHQKYYVTQIKLLSKNNKLTIFTTKILAKQIEYLIDTIVLKEIKIYIIETFSVYKALKKYQSVINNLDILILDEHNAPPTKILFLTIKPKMIMTIHNANKWLNPSFTVNPRKIIKIILRILFLKKISAIIVLNPIIKKYIIDNKFTEKKIFFMPFSLPLQYLKHNRKSSETVTITIPGMIDSSRRDYSTILNAYELFLKHSEKKNIKIVLLGRILNNTEKKIIDRIDHINTIGGNIQYWNKYIEEEEFGLYLSSTNYILSNLNTFYRGKESFEIYGITKETGIFYSTVEYGKPIILSQESVLPSIYNKFSIRYHDEKSLADIFSKISLNKKYKFEKIAVENEYIDSIDEEINMFNIMLHEKL